MALAEVKQRKRLRRRGINRWSGVRTFADDESTVIDSAAALFGQSFPGTSGSGAPVCFDYDIQYWPFDRPDTAMVVAYYSTPGVEVLPAGQARLFMRASGRMVRKKIDADGETVIEGVKPGSNGRVRYRVVDGTNVQFESTIIYTIVGFYDRQEIPEAEIQGAINKVNRSAFQKPAAAIHTLKYLGGTTSEELVQQNAKVTHTLEYLESGWVENVTSRPEALIVDERPVLLDGVDTTKTKEVLIWVPGKDLDGDGLLIDSPDVITNQYEETDLSFIRTLSIVD